MDGQGHAIRPGPDPAELPRPPPRERRLAWAGIILTSGLAWLYLLYLARDMESGMAMEMGGMAMQHAWTWLDAWLLFLMWAVMMVAMMLPSATPMILLYQRIAHQRMRQPRLSVALFAGGYLLVWTAFSAVATAFSARFFVSVVSDAIHTDACFACLAACSSILLTPAESHRDLRFL